MKRALAGIGATLVLGAGAVDASVLDEVRPNKVEIVGESRVEVKQEGNVVETTFPWKDQQGLKIKHDLGEPTIAEKLADKRKAEVITEVVPFQSGQGFKVDILLNERPASNCFTYQLEGWEDYDFFYQPPLTQEEIDEGAERPEEIVGSYAVYHKTLKNHRIGSTNYETGKFAHIPYPYVWEADNKTSTKRRAESFVIENGVMTVCVDEKFLDEATYPVRVDPTFGHTVVGASSAGLTTNDYLRGTHGYPNANADMVSVSAYLAASSTVNFKGAVYSFTGPPSNSSTTPDSDASLIGETTDGNVTSATPSWLTVTFATTTSISTNQWYLATVYLDVSTANVIIYFDVLTGYSDRRSNTFTYSTFPDPWVATSSVHLSSRFSVYATYTCTGSVCSEEFTTPGAYSWTVPTGVTSADMACWGGGGGGDIVASGAGGGGGGGAFASSSTTTVPTTSWSIFIGAGGVGDTAPGKGQDSSIAFSGATGTLADGGVAGVGTAGGNGGTTTGSNSIGDVEFAGGQGGAGLGTDDTGGGGGGAGGPGGQGGAGADGTATVGGGGGGGNGGSAGSGGTGGASTYGGAGGNGDVNGATTPGGSPGGTHQYGGGGGGGNDNGDPGGDGAPFGGGGGGGEIDSSSNTEGSDGGHGACTITYTITAAAADTQGHMKVILQSKTLMQGQVIIP